MKRINLSVIVVALAGLVAECAWGQSNCKQVKAEVSLTSPPGPPPVVAVGTITNGGNLNGTITLTDTVNAGSPTPDPFVVSFTQDIIINTHQGQLTATSVQIFDFFNLIYSLPPFGLNTGIQRIGPTSTKTGNATSTGRFAGATGYYFLNLTAVPDDNGGLIGQGQITGRICYDK